MEVTTEETNEELRGSLTVDLEDAKTGELLWRGVETKRVHETSKPSKREQVVNEQVGTPSNTSRYRERWRRQACGKTESEEDDRAGDHLPRDEVPGLTNPRVAWTCRQVFRT